MQRTMFVQIATRSLIGMGDRPDVAAAKAERIAASMDLVRDLLGDEPGVPEPPRVHPPDAGRTPPAFPPPHPSSMTDAAEEPQIIDVPQRPAYNPEATDNLIIPASVVPEAMRAQPLRSIRQQAGRQTIEADPHKLKVEDLNLMIQNMAPMELHFEAQTEAGGPRRPMKFQREVQSMHAEETVRLFYFPYGQTLISCMQAGAYVCAAMRTDDVPINLGAILAKLKADATELLKPRDRVVSIQPPLTPGAQTHPRDQMANNPQTASAAIAASALVQNTFDVAVGAPLLRESRVIESQYSSSGKPPAA
jgi:hypothetical protein